MGILIDALAYQFGRDLKFLAQPFDFGFDFSRVANRGYRFLAGGDDFLLVLYAGVAVSVFIFSNACAASAFFVIFSRTKFAICLSMSHLVSLIKSSRSARDPAFHQAPPHFQDHRTP